MIDKCVKGVESDGSIEKVVCIIIIVARANESLRFCIDYTTLMTTSLYKKSVQMPDIKSHIATVVGDDAKFITVCDVQSAYWQIPIARKDYYTTAFVTTKSKHILKVLSFGISQRTLDISTGYVSRICQLWRRCHTVFYDVGGAPQISSEHFKQHAGLILKPSKINFEPSKEVH